MIDRLWKALLENPFIKALSVGLLIYVIIFGDVYASNKAYNNDSNIIKNINLKNIQSRSLLLLLSNYNKTNIIIGSEFRNKRIDVKYESISINDLIEQIIRKQGLSFRRHNDTLLVASECRLSNPPKTYSHHRYRKDVSVNYMNVSVDAIIHAFASNTNQSIDTSEINGNYPLTLRVKNKSVAEIIQNIAVVQGLALLNNTDNTVKYIDNALINKKCIKQLTHDEALVTNVFKQSSEQDCPAELGGRPCEPLERVELEDITVLGYMEYVNDTSRFAVIESLDNVVHYVQVGNYIGRHEGQIIKISPTGQTQLIEIVSDNLGGFMEHYVELDVGIQYEDPRSKIVRIHKAPINDTEIQKQFLLAAKNNDLDKLKYLLHKGASINASHKADSANALRYAVANEHYEMTKWLISKDANVNALVKSFQMPALIIASMAGSEGMIDLLIHAGADIELADKNGYTPIYWATAKGNTNAVKQLLNKGADPSKYNNIGLSALTNSAVQGKMDIIKLFLNAGYNIDSRDRNGLTMLYGAVYKGNKSVVEMLIKLGADKSLIYGKDGTILDIAISKKNMDIAEYLRSMGAHRVNK